MTVSAVSPILDDLFSALRNSPEAEQFRLRRYAEDRLTLDLSFRGHAVAFDLLVESAEVHLLVFGRTCAARTLVDSLSANMAWLTHGDGVQHRLKAWSDSVNAERIAAETAKIIEFFVRESAWDRVEARTRKLKRDEVPAFWSDESGNFGDLIGPWLVSSMTGKRPVNVRGTLAHGGAIMSAGAVIQMLERPGYNIWGSGLSGPLHEGVVRRLGARKPASITAVRGRLTWQELSQGMSWEVPEVFGDPALLLPRIFQPPASRIWRRGEPAFMPHLRHKTLVPSGLEEHMTIIDAERPAECVTTDIASAAQVVTTSLPGMIVAQAYGVPWTWLRIAGQELAGDQFKIEDFFSTLDADSVSSVALSANELSAGSLTAAARCATVPATRVDLNRLWDAYPHDALHGKPLLRQQQRRRLVNRARSLKQRLTVGGG